MASGRSSFSFDNFNVRDYSFTDPRADLILRSSDSKDFKVFRGILYVASPQVLTTKINQVIAGDTTSTSPLPVMSMPETSHILDQLLRLLYPISNPYPDTCSLDDVRAILRSAISYEMGTVIQTMRNRLTSRVLV